MASDRSGIIPKRGFTNCYSDFFKWWPVDLLANRQRDCFSGAVHVWIGPILSMTAKRTTHHTLLITVCEKTYSIVFVAAYQGSAAYVSKTYSTVSVSGGEIAE